MKKDCHLSQLCNSRTRLTNSAFYAHISLLFLSVMTSDTVHVHCTYMYAASRLFSWSSCMCVHVCMGVWVCVGVYMYLPLCIQLLGYSHGLFSVDPQLPRGLLLQLLHIQICVSIKTKTVFTSWDHKIITSADMLATIPRVSETRMKKLAIYSLHVKIFVGSDWKAPALM